MEEKKRWEGKICLSRKRLKYFLSGSVGALGFLLLGKLLERGKPYLKELVKEGLSFKEWLEGKVEEILEDAEDIVAEAKYNYYQDTQKSKEFIKREKEILEKLEKLLEKKTEN